jgi:glucose/arabinose dehydrogenase
MRSERQKTSRCVRESCPLAQRAAFCQPIARVRTLARSSLHAGSRIFSRKELVPMTRFRMAWFASLCLLAATGCEDGEKTERADASDPVFFDAALGFDAGSTESDAALDAGDAGVFVPGGDAALATDAAVRDASEMDGSPDGQSSDASTDGALDAALADASTDAEAGTADAASDAAASDAAADAARDAAVVACASDNGGISLPRGFCATRFAEGLPGPRHMVVTPAGDLFVATAPKEGASPSFIGLRDADRDGKAEQRENVGNVPGNGIDWRGGFLYFGANANIVRYPLANGLLKPSAEPVVIVRDLPATPDHTAKTVVVSGTRLYVNIGSASNSCQQQNRTLESPGVDPCTELTTRGGVWQFDANRENQTQSDGTRFATGTRNANALALNAAGALFTAQNSRDQLHENWPDAFSEEDDLRLPAEGIFRLSQGDDYGWPYCYYDAEAAQYFLAPEYGGDGETVGRCANIKRPVSTLPAHWAPLGMVFYQGTQFPARYQRGAFIANHGSRFAPNASDPLPGYNVVFIPFTQSGTPAGPFERFAEDFAGSGRPLPDNAQHRPVGVAVAPDGALFVSDDKGGVIFRIVYRGT